MSDNLEDIITDSVNDSINGSADTPEIDTPSDAVEAPVSDSEPAPEPEAEETLEVSSPANVEAPEATPAEPQDEFAKLAGMPQMGVGGRENRIPYSRVKKIAEKGVNDLAEAAIGRKLNAGEKAIDVVKAHVAQLPELQTKVTEYESRLEAIGRFEQVMENDPEKFLTMLAKVPAYEGFFTYLKQAQDVMNGVAPAPTAQTPAAPVDPAAGMPEPDDILEDGSKVYSMEGLKALLAWNAAQTESRVSASHEAKLKELQARYDPMATDWQERRRQEAVLPVIQKQIAEAKTWHLFNESEQEILDVLRKDKSISLEGAYRQVVFPKLVAERNKMRQDVLKEVKGAPASTSVAARTATKPTPASEGPKNLEDIIRTQIQSLK